VLDVTTVKVGTGVIVCVNVELVLALKFPSPLYSATIEWVPAVSVDVL